MRIVAAIFLCSLASIADAGSRLRVEEGARTRQTRLASSSGHTCAVLDDGTVRCWGGNIAGAVGTGTTSVAETSPVQVSGLTNIVSITAGGGHGHTCALHTFGAVFCWGDNSFGQLGDGTLQQRLTPVQVKGLDNVRAIAAGDGFTCALRVDGGVWCWGSNDSGQLGIGIMSTAELAPVQPLTGLPAVAITAGEDHACAILLDPNSGAIAKCWGLNDRGQLGTGSAALSVAFPARVSGLAGVIDISGGSAHTCALLVESSVHCWGRNDFGQLGKGSNSPTSVSTPVSVVFDSGLHLLSGAVAVSAGGRHSCAILADGSVRCWGDDTNGQLGDANTNTQRAVANTAVVGLNDAFEITTGNNFTCAVEVTNFTGRCWGANNAGQLGNGTTNPASVPNTVNGVPGSTGIGGRSIRASDRWSCARRGNASLACWGGPGSNPAGPNPLTVSVAGNGFSLVTGLSKSCALQSAGIANCFLNNNLNGADGYGPGVVGFAQGNQHACELLVNGTVLCFGSNSRGQLGNSNVGSSSQTFVTVLDSNGVILQGIVMISSGGFHTCAVRVDGKVFCWGDNTSGQLGLGTVGGFDSFASPVVGLGNIVAVSANLDAVSSGLGSRSFTCALSAVGGASCWGYGLDGQLGNGSNPQTQSIAETVFGLTNATAVAAGGSHACAVLADSSAVCWGNDSHDQLGGADTADHNAPVPVIQNFSTVKGVTIPFRLAFLTAIAPGVSHTCSLQATGLVRCWGDNSAGELGNGTTSSTPQPRPIIVNSFTANVDPAVSLKTNSRIAIVTALINCPAGEAQITLTLEQGNSTGTAHAVSTCEGGLVSVPIQVPAQGPSGFHPGAATANVDALVKDSGTTIEDQHWTRQVILTVQP